MDCKLERRLSDEETEMLIPLFEHFQVLKSSDINIGEIYSERTPHDYNIPLLIQAQCNYCIDHIKLSHGHYCIRQSVVDNHEVS